VNSASESSEPVLRRLWKHRGGRAALIVLSLFVLAAIVGPFFAQSSIVQTDIVGMANRPPSWAHLFGTDHVSRDVLSRVLSGARISLAVSSLAVLLSVTLGTFYGIVAGFLGGRVDNAMMRVLDGFMSIPRVLLLICVLTFWQPVQLPGLIVLIGATGWFGVSRFVRAETLTVRNLEYIASARALGASSNRILWRHVLPNVIAPVTVTATLSVGNVLVLESGLSYLGIGANPPTASWGSMFMDGVNSFAGNWWVAFFPGVAIVATVLAVNVLGDALRDVLDPRQLHAPSAPEPLENG
jgi:ABC-type dipeptide/oligopeptide/nickel transport system permease subunit